MSRWWTGIALGVGLVSGYLTSGTAVAQGQRFPAQPGANVELHLDPNDGGFSCVVIEVRGDFIGCKGTGRQEGGENWYNLAMVGRIHISAR